MCKVWKNRKESMKKILLVVGLAQLVLQSDAISSIEAYKRKSNIFCEYSDLAPGYVLLKSQLLPHARSNGFIHYSYKEGQRVNNQTNVNSYEDIGYNSFFDLLIQLFPSTGVQFNAEGEHSILSHTKENLINLISGMFHIDRKAREILKNKKKQEDIFGEIEKIEEIEKEIEKIKGNKKNANLITDLKKEFCNKYFGIDKSIKIKYQKQAFRLGRNIAKSVLLEQRKEGSEDHIPPSFTNYLIKAYIWKVLPDDKLEELALARLVTDNFRKVVSDDDRNKIAEFQESKLPFDDKLKKLFPENTPSRTDYVSNLTERIYNDIEKNVSLIPFPMNQTPITNGLANYKGESFPDCVETVLRQLFAIVFSSSVLSSGGYTSELILDLDRIPEKSALRNFFAPEKGKIRDIRELANDGSTEIRSEWAEIVSNLPYMRYKDQKSKYELYGGWSNIIKVFCYLMKGYSASQGGQITARKQKAEERIKEINEALEQGKFSHYFDSNSTLDIVNDLLGVRTDVELIIDRENSKLSKFSYDPDEFSDISGCISIYPKGHSNGNTANIISYQEKHACIGYISAKISGENITKSWIEDLYINPKRAIEGTSQYSKLSSTNYPELAFVERLASAPAENDELYDYAGNLAIEVLHFKNPPIEAIYRAVIANPHCDNLRYLIVDCLIPGYKEIPEKNKIDLCNFIVDRSCSFKHIAAARELLLQYEENPFPRNYNISEEYPFSLLLALKAIASDQNKIDNLVCKHLENCSTKDLFDDLPSFSWFCPCNKEINYPTFGKPVLDALTPHLTNIVNEKIRDFLKLQNFLEFLDFIDFDNTNDTLNEFVNYTYGKALQHTLYCNHYRSQAKLKLLLPYSGIGRKDVADRIVKDFEGNFNINEVWGIANKIPNESIEKFLNKIELRNFEDAKLLIDKFNLRYTQDSRRIELILAYFREKYPSKCCFITEYVCGVCKNISDIQKLEWEIKALKWEKKVLLRNLR